MARSLQTRAGGWGSLWLVTAGLWASGVAAAAKEFAVYDCRAEAVWGHWGRVYEQTFIPPASGRLSYFTFIGAAKRGPFPVTCTLLDAKTQQPLSPPQTLTLKDDEGRTVAGPFGKAVRLTQGRRYALRLENPDGWALYVGEGEPVSGSLTLDGEELEGRALLGKVVLDCQPARLRLERVVSDTREVILPDTSLSVSLFVVNAGETPAQVLQAGLRFYARDKGPGTGDGGSGASVGEKGPLVPDYQPGDRGRDLTARYFVAPAPNNPRVIYGGETAEFRFHVEAFHDTPEGEVEIGGWVEWYDAADNLLDNAGFERGSMAPPREWSWWVEPEGDLQAVFAWDEGLGEALPLAPGLEKEWQEWIGATRRAGAGPANHPSLTLNHQPSTLPHQPSRSLRFTIEDNAAEGVMTSDSAPVWVGPGREYVAGVWTKSSDAGLMTSLHKVLVVREFRAVWPQEELANEHHQTLWEGKFWNHQRVRFVTGEETEYVRVSLRMNAYGTGLKGSVWWDEVYLLPVEALRETAETEQPHRWTVRLTEESYRLADGSWSPVMYVGEDRKTQGDWSRRYGQECFILCAMYAPDDVFGWSGTPHTVFNWATAVRYNVRKPLDYFVRTGDPEDPPRLWLGANYGTDRRALYDPSMHYFRGQDPYTYGSWDDHGEVHPYDWQGPDLYVDLAIPTGEYLLSLYFVDFDCDPLHPRNFRVGLLGPDLSYLLRLRTGYCKDGIYKSVYVRGPQRLTVKIAKDNNVCTILSGVFLDPVLEPGALYDAVWDLISPGGTQEADKAASGLEQAGLRRTFADLREVWHRSRAESYLALDRWARLAEAAQDCVGATRAQMEAMEAWLIAAEGHRQTGDWEGYEKAFRHSIATLRRIVPGERLARFLRTQSAQAYEARQFHLASLWTEELIKLLGESAAPVARDAAVQFYFVDRRYAMSKLEQYLRLSTGEATREQAITAMRKEAQAFCSENRFDFAVTVWEQLHDRFGEGSLDDADFYDLGWSYIKLSAFTAAEAAFRTLAEKRPPGEYTARAHVMWGCSILGQGDFDRAREVLGEALKRYKDPAIIADARRSLETIERWQAKDRAAR